jgi:hypothetical protein
MKPVFVVNKGDDVEIVLDMTGSPSPNITQQNRDSYFKKKNTCFKQKIA